MKKILFILVGFLITLGSCEDGFEEFAVDPNNPVVVPSSLILGNVIRVANNTNYWSFTGGDMGACWAQQWAKVQYNDEERYIVRTGVVQTFWDTYYADVISDANDAYQFAVAEENAAVQGAALVMQAYGFLMLTDAFGDIPFTEAIKGTEGNFAPVYDSQETVYDGVLALLDRADEALALGTGGFTATSDLVYAGDITKWRKFANSLKFRALMRISAKRDVAAELQALVSSGKLFASRADEAKMAYLDNDPNANPIYETIVFGGRAEYKVSDVLVDMLNTFNDPRLPVYAQKNEDGEYRGKPAGLKQLPSDDYNYTNVSAIGEMYVDPNLPGVMVGYTELMFLMAEAALNGDISGDASTYYLKGIESSFAENGVSDAYAAYVAQAPIILSATKATAEKQIGEQKWLALFGQGLESWFEWKRTQYPILAPALESTLATVPYRFAYPTLESSINKTNYDAAAAAIGTDKLTTKVWWMN